MAFSSLDPGILSDKDARNQFIVEQMEDYEAGDYTESDLSGYFGDSFKNREFTDFKLCNYNKLILLRKLLRSNGVYVELGRTKAEVIEALMAAVKDELPWPSTPNNHVLEPSENFEHESWPRNLFRKPTTFEPRQKVEEEVLEMYSQK